MGLGVGVLGATGLDGLCCAGVGSFSRAMRVATAVVAGGRLALGVRLLLCCWLVVLVGTAACADRGVR